MKKKILLFILLICLFINVSALSGDIDGNGKVEVRDYLLLRKHLIKTSLLTGLELQNADVNKDDKVNSADYVMIRKIILKIIEPVEVLEESKDYIEAYFLNTLTNPSQNGVSYTTNNSFIFRIMDNGSYKYVLLDTGIAKSKDQTQNGVVKTIIYNKLKELQGTEKVTIDYLVLSHMHGDHIGNAVSLINDPNVTINNIVYKKESKTKSTVDKIEKAIKNKGINTVIETNSVAKNNSSYLSYGLSNNVMMYLFNVSDVYANDECSKTDYFVSFGAKYNDTYRYDVYYDESSKTGKLIYFTGKEYLEYMTGVKSELKMHIASTFDKDQISNLSAQYDNNPDVNARINNLKFYAYINPELETRNPCTSNANSLAVVFKVNTGNTSKYIYLPNDIENAGYSAFGEVENGVIITGFTTRINFEYSLINDKPYFILNNNQFVPNKNVPPVKKASEYLTANNIVKELSGFDKNLVIYQASHHGINNTWSAMKTLNVNRKDVYCIVPSGSNPQKSNTWDNLEGGYLLQNTKMIIVGGKYNNKYQNGVKCTINNIGHTECGYY